MKTVLFLSLGCLAVAMPATAANLAIDLDGVRNSPGTLYISVQTREQFKQDRGVAGSVVKLASAGSHRFAYEVPAGEYAISVWHDDNGNGTFDKDGNYMPLDGWAMPNADKLRGEPTFDQIKTVVSNSPATIPLSMVYGRNSK